ncbi:MAG: VOC family protein [Hamadaea sp.]|nr:VOC family protein [Hamadaea sp.]
MSHPVVHWEIGARDAEASREFYAKAFGWTMTDAGPGYTLVPATDGGLAGGIMQTQPGMPPYVTVYVQVDDLVAKLTEIAALGGATIVPPTDIDENMSFAMFADPDGAVVGLLKATGPVAGPR